MLEFCVNGLAGDLCRVCVGAAANVDDLKKAIEAATHIPAEGQRLVHGSAELRGNSYHGGLPGKIGGAAVQLSLIRRPQQEVAWLQRFEKEGCCWWGAYAEEPAKCNREVALAAVTSDGRNLRHFSEELRADREVVLAAVSNEGWALQYASTEVQADKEVVLAAASRAGSAVLRYAAEELQEDSEVERIAAAADDLELYELTTEEGAAGRPERG